jgi:hypothetical protein
MVKGPKQISLQRRHTDGQQVYENVLNHSPSQGNMNQDHRVSPLTCQDGHHQRGKR